MAAARIRTGTVPAARLPQRHLVGQRTGRRVAGSLRAGCARRLISHPQCGSRRRFASSACHHATGRGRWQPCQRGAGFARGYTPQPARPPSVAGCHHAAPSPDEQPTDVSTEQRTADEQPLGAGDTPPRVELPRPATGGAISPTPPDTRRLAWPRAPRFRRVHAHAIPASHLPVNALRPRSRPDYRTACVTSRHHRRCSSVRSPAGVTRRHHGGRPATRHPHCASLLRCRCGRPAAAFHVPSAAAATAATNSAACSRSRRVLRTPYRLRNRPATRRCGLIIKSARVAGLAGRCHPQAWWQPPVIRTGTVSAASLAAVAVRRPAHRPAASQAPCVPVRTPTFPRPQCGSRRHICRAPATTPGAGMAAGPPGRGLCAWIHAPARTPAVMTGCHTPRPHDSKFTIVSQHQCTLPRRLSAEDLARAFAPRRATSGLVHRPPASGASGGESRSLGKRITPQKTRLYSFARVSSRGIPLRGSTAWRCLGGSPQTLPAAPVPAFDRHSCLCPAPTPRHCTRSRQRFGYSRRRATAFVMPVAHGASRGRLPVIRPS